MLWWRGVVPEGDTRIQAGVQRSETPERRPPHQYLNPEGVTDFFMMLFCHPFGVLLSVLISTGVAPLPMSMYRGCTPAYVHVQGMHPCLCSVALSGLLGLHYRRCINVSIFVGSIKSFFKCKPLIVLYSVCFKEHFVFITEGTFLVMLCLITDIIHCLFN